MRNKQLSYQQLRYRRLVGEGLCTICGKEAPEALGRRCPDCAEKDNERHLAAYHRSKIYGRRPLGRPASR
jgi:hypothetical protein